MYDGKNAAMNIFIGQKRKKETNDQVLETQAGGSLLQTHRASREPSPASSVSGGQSLRQQVEGSN